MTIGRSIPRYGRLQVGQRVRFERVLPAPTPERATLGRGVETVTIRTEHLVDDIRPCDSGALVTLRHADGLGDIRECFNRGEARVGQLQARFRCIGGIDVDPAAMRDFERLAGVPGTVLDMFDREQFTAFHGHEPPADWRGRVNAAAERCANEEKQHG